MPRFYRDSFLFHHQVRIGRGGKPIVVTKFRTMERGAHQEREKVLLKEDHTLQRFKIEDPRTTRFGRLLRRNGFDELPQLIDVLRGKLRPVGIRPMLYREWKSLPPDLREIYNEMGPGFAGLLYSIKPFPPTVDQAYDNYREFYKEWKKKPYKAYLKYGGRILWNRITGKAWSV